MTRQVITKRGDKLVGEFPPEGGWQNGRRGVRRVLCSVEDVKHLSEIERTRKLASLYQEKQKEILGLAQQQEADRKKKKQEKRKWTIRQASRVWLDAIAADNSPETINNYRCTINYYIASNTDHPLRDFELLKYSTFIKHLKKQPGKQPGSNMSATTVNKHARQLQVFLNWAYAMEILDKLHKLKKPQKDMDTYEVEDLLKIRSWIETRLEKGRGAGDRKEVTRMTNALRVWWLATYSAMRLGPLWAMKLSWIDLDKQIIRIQDNPDINWKNKQNKWPNKPITDKLLDFMVNDLKNRDKKEVYFLDKV